MDFVRPIMISFYEKKFICKEKRFLQLLRNCGSNIFIQIINVFNWIINLYFPFLIFVVFLFFIWFVYDIDSGLEVITELEEAIPVDFCNGDMIQEAVPLICAASGLILSYLENKLYNFKNENIIIWYFGTIKLYLFRVMPFIFFVSSLVSDDFKLLNFITLIMSIALLFINIHLSAVMSIKRLSYAMFEQVLRKEIKSYSKLNKKQIKENDVTMLNDSLTKIKEIFKNTSDNNLKIGTFDLKFSTPEVALFKKSFYCMEKTRDGYFREYNWYKLLFIIYIFFKLLIMLVLCYFIFLSKKNVINYLFVLPLFIIIICQFVIEWYNYDYSVTSLMKAKKIVFKNNPNKDLEERIKNHFTFYNNLLQDELYLMIKKNGRSSVFVSDLMTLLELLEDDFYSIAENNSEVAYKNLYRLHKLSLYYAICYTYVKEILEAENPNKRQQSYHDFYLFITKVSTIYENKIKVSKQLKDMIQINLIYLMAKDNNEEFDKYFICSDRNINNIINIDSTTTNWINNKSVYLIDHLKKFGSKDLFGDMLKSLSILLPGVCSLLVGNTKSNLLELKKDIQNIANKVL